MRALLKTHDLISDDYKVRRQRTGAHHPAALTATRHSPSPPATLTARTLGPNQRALDVGDRLSASAPDHVEAWHTEPEYQDIAAVLTFLVLLWVAGKLVTKVGAPALVGELFVGIMLGPNLANFVPFPEAAVLFGEVGLMLLVLEAGLDVDLQMLRVIGVRGVAVALVGTLCPLTLAFVIALMIGLEARTAFAMGVALAPTSMGIALNVLKKGQVPALFLSTTRGASLRARLSR